MTVAAQHPGAVLGVLEADLRHRGIGRLYGAAYVGQDAETGGWRASRETGDGGQHSVIYRIITRTLADLDRELDEEGRDGPSA